MLLPAFHQEVVCSPAQRLGRFPRPLEDDAGRDVCGLLKLPTELLLEILEDAFDLRDRDPVILYQLSLLCRRLQAQLLPVYLVRAGLVRSTSHATTLTLKEAKQSLLPVLHKSGLLTGIHHFRYYTLLDGSGKFSPPQYLRQLHAIQDFVQSLKRPHEISIDFTGVEFWMLTRNTEDAAYYHNCVNSMPALLQTIASTPCRSFTVTSGVHPLVTRWPTCLEPFGTIATKQVKEHRDTTASAHTPLCELNINSLMFLIPPTIDNTRTFLSSASISHLSLGYLYGASKSVTTALSSLTIPSLTALSITRIDLPWRDIQAFISRHPFITTLSLGQGLSLPPSLDPPRKPLLPKLTHLLSTPSHLSWGLNFSSQPSLHTICLMTNMSRYNPLSKAIHHLHNVLKSPLNDTEINLYLSIDDHAVPQPQNYASDPAMAKCAEILRGVTKVEIVTAWKFVMGFAEHLPLWLSNFPRLREVAVPVEDRPSMAEPRISGFVEAMRRACPSVRRIRVYEREFVLC